MQYRGILCTSAVSMARKQKTRYRERQTLCGDYMFVDVFPVFPAGEYVMKGGKRRKRYRPTSEIQKRLNDRRSENAAEEIVHANFSVGDNILHLTYADGWRPETDEQAERDMDNFLRRLKRKYDRAGAEFKYFCISAKGEQAGRQHFHVYLSGGIDRSEIEACWKFGYANCDALQFTETGICDLTKYTHGQIPLGSRRWRCSRNCKRPEPLRERDYTYDRRRVIEVAESPYSASSVISDLYPGYVLSEMPRLCLNDVNGGAYMRMMLYRDDAEFMKIRRGMGKYRKESPERFKLPTPEELQVSISV